MAKISCKIFKPLSKKRISVEDRLKTENENLKNLLHEALLFINIYKNRAENLEQRCNDLEDYLRIKYKDY